MAANAADAPSGGSVLMDGWMMKKKSGGTLLRSLGTQWVTRYFVLHANGRLVYYRSMTYNGTQPPKPDGIVCEDMAQCTIDIAKPSDAKGNEEAVANSFCITAPGGKKGSKPHGTLLVTKGPTDFKKWIGACRGMGATMLHGVDANVKESKKAQDVSKGVPTSSKTTGDSKSKVVEVEKSTPAVEAAPTAPVVEAPPPPSSIKPQDGSVDDSTASLHVRFVPENNIEEIIDEDEIHAKWKPGEEVIKSVSFSEGEDVVIDDDDDDDEVEEEEAALVDEEVEKDEAAAVEDTNEVADAAAEETEVEEPVAGTEPTVEKEEECLEMDTPSKDVHEEEAAIAEDAKDAVMDSEPPEVEESVKEDEAVEVAEEVKPSKEDEAMSRREAARKRMEEAKARRESKRMAAAAKAGEGNEKGTSAAPAAAEPLKDEATSSAAEGGLAGSDEKIKVFAYGDAYNEMTRALDSKKVLFGVMTTSIEVLGDDEAYLNAHSKGEHEKLMPISIEYEGNDAHYTDVNKFKNRLHEIGPLIKGYCGVEKLHPIVYEHTDKAREQILTLLGAAPRKEDDDDTDLPGSFMMGKGQWTPSAKISTTETSGKTAYKHALDLYGISNVPNGPDLLKIVREEFGQPYNWVVFKPSKTELVVEDAGSGGVMEMAKVVSECYDDKVLFGLARLSFSGDFGLRQFFCGLEWKGPNCGGVKAMRAIRECLKPMKEMIGKRSFTLSNDVTSDMTPGTLVDLVKRSSNVGYLDASVSVMSMENAHIEEQKAMKKYWKKLAQKERAKKQKEKEVNDKEIEEEDRDILKARDEKLSSLKQVRAARKEKWATMTAPEVLQDLGQASMSGWVLLEVNL